MAARFLRGNCRLCICEPHPSRKIEVTWTGLRTGVSLPGPVCLFVSQESRFPPQNVSQGWSQRKGAGLGVGIPGFQPGSAVRRQASPLISESVFLILHWSWLRQPQHWLPPTSQPGDISLSGPRAFAKATTPSKECLPQASLSPSPPNKIPPTFAWESPLNNFMLPDEEPQHLRGGHPL